MDAVDFLLLSLRFVEREREKKRIVQFVSIIAVNSARENMSKYNKEAFNISFFSSSSLIISFITSEHLKFIFISHQRYLIMYIYLDQIELPIRRIRLQGLGPFFFSFLFLLLSLPSTTLTDRTKSFFRSSVVKGHESITIQHECPSLVYFSRCAMIQSDEKHRCVWIHCLLLSLILHFAASQTCQNDIPDFFYNVSSAGPLFDQSVYTITTSNFSVGSPINTTVFTFNIRPQTDYTRPSFVSSSATGRALNNTAGIITIQSSDPSFIVYPLSNGSYVLNTNT